MHANYIKLLKQLELKKVFQHVAVYINHHQRATARAYLKLHSWFQCTCRYRLIQCYGGICRHSTENGYNDTYTGTRNVILAKHKL
jgi:hypothetical protein